MLDSGLAWDLHLEGTAPFPVRFAMHMHGMLNAVHVHFRRASSHGKATSNTSLPVNARLRKVPRSATLAVPVWCRPDLVRARWVTFGACELAFEHSRPGLAALPRDLRAPAACAVGQCSLDAESSGFNALGQVKIAAEAAQQLISG